MTARLSNSVSARSNLSTALGVGTAIVIFDQITKRWALGALEDRPCSASADACIDLFWTLRFHLVFNPGASFSRGESLGVLFGLLAMVMTVVLLKMSFADGPRWRGLLFGAITGGAVGNLLDRIFRAEDGFLSGEVVDFVDLQWWPIFNVADVAIVGGIIVLIAVSFYTERGAAPDSAAPDSAAPDSAASDSAASDSAASDSVGGSSD